ncbi:MAG: oxidoreductase [Fibrobacteres bacterium]|nr:oxidoreductase [Fibrobacterota bacterium]
MSESQPTNTEERMAESAARKTDKESDMSPKPQSQDWSYRGSGKLMGKTALITGGDSGIGRATAVFYAREGADVAIIYLDEHEDARETGRMVESEGQRCIALAGDVGDQDFCRKAVEETVKAFGKLDILVNNAAEQTPQKDVGDISEDQLEGTFRTNIFGYFFMTQAALPHLRRQKGSAIINTSSVTAYRGSEELLDYSATKGAIVAYTRSLSKSLAKEGIRVNGVAPGPIWTPLISSTFPPEKVASFGKNVPLGRPGQPEEVAPSYVFLASDDASYFTGQFLHPNGGEIVNA